MYEKGQRKHSNEHKKVSPLSACKTNAENRDLNSDADNDCHPGQWHDASTDDCVSCPAGRFRSEDNHQFADCHECEKGTFSSTEASQCTPCKPGRILLGKRILT